MHYLVSPDYEPIMLPRKCVYRRRIETAEYGELVLVDVSPPIPVRNLVSQGADQYVAEFVGELALRSRWPDADIFPQDSEMVRVSMYIVTKAGSPCGTAEDCIARPVLDGYLHTTLRGAEGGVPPDAERRGCF